jgi:hypothetical protein
VLLRDLAGGGDLHQAVLVPLHHQDRSGHRRHRFPIGAGIEEQPQQGPDRRQERLVHAGDVLAGLDQVDRPVDHRRGHGIGVDPAHPKHVANTTQWRLPLPAQPQETLPDTRDGVERELGGDERVQLPAAPRDGGVEQNQVGDRLRRPGRGEDRDHPAHRVADQDDGFAGDLGQEPVEHLDVGLHRRPALPRLATPEAREVQGEDAGVRPQQRGQEVPVEVRATETVHEDDPAAVFGTAEVDVVHRPVEVDGAALAGRLLGLGVVGHGCPSVGCCLVR